MTLSERSLRGLSNQEMVEGSKQQSAISLPIDETKYQVVVGWLKAVYGNPSSIPQFEVTPNTIEVLYSLAQKNMERDRDAEQRLHSARDITTEYRLEADRMEETLTKLGMGTDTLSAPGGHNLLVLARLAEALKVKDCSLPCLMVALAEARLKTQEISDMRTQYQTLASNTDRSIKKALETYNELSSLHSDYVTQNQTLDGSTQSKLQDIAYLESKAHQYQGTLKNLKEQINNSGVVKDICHAPLVRLANSTSELKKQTAPLASALKSYYSLPPDLTMAQLKIEEEKRKLDNIEDELASRMHDMNIYS